MYNTGPYAERARAEIVRTNVTTRETEVGETAYWLQVDAYGSQEKAEAVATDLRAKNYRDVEVVKSGREWEVRVGKFNSRNAASRAQVDAQLIGLSTSVRPRTFILPH
jgi:cell division protein FtsN